MLPQLLLPAEDARFVAGFFSFGDHAFALVGARNCGPGKDVFRIEREDALRGFNRTVKILLSVVGLRQAMQRVAKLGVEFERPHVFRDGLRQFSFAEEVNSGVVVIFRGAIRSAAHAVILSFTWRLTFWEMWANAPYAGVNRAKKEERSLAALGTTPGAVMRVRGRAGFVLC